MSKNKDGEGAGKLTPEQRRTAEEIGKLPDFINNQALVEKIPDRLKSIKNQLWDKLDKGMQDILQEKTESKFTADIVNNLLGVKGGGELYEHIASIDERLKIEYKNGKDISPKNATLLANIIFGVATALNMDDNKASEFTLIDINYDLAHFASQKLETSLAELSGQIKPKENSSSTEYVSYSQGRTDLLEPNLEEKTKSDSDIKGSFTSQVVKGRSKSTGDIRELDF